MLQTQTMSHPIMPTLTDYSRLPVTALGFTT